MGGAGGDSADYQRSLDVPQLANPQSCVVVFAGHLGCGVCRAHVFHLQSPVEFLTQAALHAISLAMAAMHGYSVHFAYGAGSSKMDCAHRALSGNALSSCIRLASFSAAVVGHRR